MDPSDALDPVPYATPDEYAARLRVCVGTVFAWLKRGMPSVKAGKVRRIPVAKADGWLEAGGADGGRRSRRRRRPEPARG